MRKDFFSKAIMCLDSRYYEKIVWKPIYLDLSLPLAPHIRGGPTSLQIALFQKGGNVTESKWHIPSFQRRRACEFHNQKKAEGLDAMAVLMIPSRMCNIISDFMGFSGHHQTTTHVAAAFWHFEALPETTNFNY